MFDLVERNGLMAATNLIHLTLKNNTLSICFDLNSHHCFYIHQMSLLITCTIEILRVSPNCFSSNLPDPPTNSLRNREASREFLNHNFHPLVFFAWHPCDLCTDTIYIDSIIKL